MQDTHSPSLTFNRYWWLVQVFSSCGHFPIKLILLSNPLTSALTQLNVKLVTLGKCLQCQSSLLTENAACDIKKSCVVHRHINDTHIYPCSQLTRSIRWTESQTGFVLHVLAISVRIEPSESLIRLFHSKSFSAEYTLILRDLRSFSDRIRFFTQVPLGARSHHHITLFTSCKSRSFL